MIKLALGLKESEVKQNKNRGKLVFFLPQHVKAAQKQCNL